METQNVEVELDENPGVPATTFGVIAPDWKQDHLEVLDASNYTGSNPPCDVGPESFGGLRETAKAGFEATKSEAYNVAKQRAIKVSYVSIGASIVVAFAGILVSLEGGALAVLGLAGETLLDGVSSLMVIWRFKEGKPRQSEDAEEAERRLEARNMERERKFTLVIGISFTIFAGFLLMLSFVHIRHQWATTDWEEWAASKSWYVAWPAFVIFSVFSKIKFELAAELDSKTLRQDAICSIFGAFLAFLTGLASSLENTLVQSGDDAKAFGMVDPMASCAISTLIMAEGCRTVFHNSLYFQTHHEFA